MDDQALWLTKDHVLTLIGRSSEYFRTVIRPGLRADEAARSTGRGKPWLFYAPAVVRELIAATGRPPTDDEAGPPTEWLEELRKTRTLRERRLLLLENSELIPRAVLHESAAFQLQAVRRFTQTVLRRLGPEIQTQWNEALDEAREQMQRYFQPATGCRTELTVHLAGGERLRLALRYGDDGRLGWDFTDDGDEGGEA